MSVSANNNVDAGEQSEEGLGEGHAGESRTRRVLLVEEQAHVVRVIRHNLERCGFQVDSAENVDGAMQLMMGTSFDALIMTGEWPDTDILELCRRGSELLTAHTTEAGETLAPLMLVSCSEDNALADELPGLESLGQPVSLKRIVERLHEKLGETASGLPA